MTMIGAKNLATLMSRKLRRLARRKRITLPGWHSDDDDQLIILSNNNGKNATSSMNNNKAEKGRFVVYTSDSRRFALPLAYLDNGIFRELLELAEEEFGLPRNRPLTLPFESVFMDYLIWLIQRNVGTDILHKALLSLVPSSRCYCSFNFNNVSEQENPHLVIQGF